MITLKLAPDRERPGDAEGFARLADFDPRATGLIRWDVFEAVLTPGDFAFMLTWFDQETAKRVAGSRDSPEVARIRRVRIIRDYGMYDRREAPQYYPDAEGAKTIQLDI